MNSLLPGILDYRRNYVGREGAFVYPGAAPMDFDVVTEQWFADREAYEAFIAKATDPEIAGHVNRSQLNAR